MDISNKTLALFLLGAIVVSLGGTILSLNKLEQVSTTGLVTQTGTIDLQINESVSITTQDNDLIDFGTCTPLTDSTTTINSEGSEDTTAACGAYTDRGIFVRNNGNVDVNVTIRSDTVGATQGGEFLNTTDGTSSLLYRTVNLGSAPNSGGCGTGLVPSYTEFINPNEEYLVCGNLTTASVGGANSFETHIQIVIPDDAQPGVAGALLTFFAEQI
ncbi:MAG: hypothetical protein ACMXX9_01410 [Candidatus Woesearchaeota archaeon]